MLATCEQALKPHHEYAQRQSLGGTSAINGMLYVRGQAQDYDGWAQAGNKGWSFVEVCLQEICADHFGKCRYDEGFHGGQENSYQPATNTLFWISL